MGGLAHSQGSTDRRCRVCTAVRAVKWQLTHNSIIAIHGLNPMSDPDHAETTWKKEERLWLRDFLPDEPNFPTSRVLLFAYNSNAVFRTGAKLSAQSMNLLDRLRAKREVWPSHVLSVSANSNNVRICKVARLCSFVIVWMDFWSRR